MINFKVSGETPFQINAHSFAVSPSTEEYTLAYSADGISYTSYSESTPIGENLFVNGVPKSCFFRLLNNQSEVTVTY